MWSWMGPRNGLDGRWTCRLSPGFNPRTVRHVASLYTDGVNQNCSEWRGVKFQYFSADPNSQLTSRHAPNSLINTVDFWRQNYARFITLWLESSPRLGMDWITDNEGTRVSLCVCVCVCDCERVCGVNKWLRTPDLWYRILSCVLWRLENKMK